MKLLTTDFEILMFAFLKYTKYFTKLFFYSDGVIRVFSSSPERQAPDEEQQAFLDSVASSNIPSQIGDVKTDDLPGTEALLNPGKLLYDL